MTRAAVLLWLLFPVVADAQAPEADPIRCWWRTSAGAVAVGEPFAATLTCAAREDPASRTVPDETPLGAAAIRLAPFEILGGSRPSDLRSRTHRFFQYHYTLRIIDPDVIGHDATFPDVQIAYRVDTLTGGEWSPGRDRVYIVPGQAVRLLSLVPSGANDIRDSGDESFARTEALRFRSRALEIAAVALIVLGALVAAPAAVAILRRGRPVAVLERRLPRRTVLSVALEELAAVQRDSGGGWTPDLAARVLNALRLAAATAIGTPIVERPAGGDAGAGALVADHGLLHQRRVAVSSALTANDIRQALTRLPLTATAAQRQLLEDLLEATTTFTRAVYAAQFDPHARALDQAFISASHAARRVR